MKLPRRAVFSVCLLTMLALVIIVLVRSVQEKRIAVQDSSVAASNMKPTLLSRSYERLRGAHYFADTYPKNFWNSFEPADVVRDFAQIKSDGFNAVVLVLPWAEFQPSLTTGVHDERMFERLKFLMDEASKASLGVVLRLSYIWSYRPDAENSIFERMHGVFHNEDARETWLAHLAEIHKRVGKHSAFRLAFVSWEDLYPMALTSENPSLDDQNMLRVYREYLSRTAKLSEISTLYGKTFSNWDEVPFPSRKSPAYAKVFDYWDDALINRLFIPANKRFPNLSFEVRGDWDPVWGNDGKIVWKNHASTYALPGTDTLTSYYATSWGMKNEGDLASAAESVKGFERFVEHLGAMKNRQHLFIDQFLFYYELEEFKRNTQVKPNERDEFLREMAKRFRDQDISYALWYYRDFVDNVVYNAHFSLGLDGWQTSPDVKIVELPDGHLAAALNKGDQITQKIPARQRGAWKGGDALLDICITREPSAATSVDIVAGGRRVQMNWRKGEKRKCGKIQRAAEFELSIKALSRSVNIDLVEVFTVLEPSAMYDRNLKAGTQLNAIHKLNSMVAGELTLAK